MCNGWQLFICVHYTHKHMLTHRCRHSHTHVCTPMNMHPHTHAHNTNTHTYTHIHTHTHTYTHTHTDTHTTTHTLELGSKAIHELLWVFAMRDDWLNRVSSLFSGVDGLQATWYIVRVDLHLQMQQSIISWQGKSQSTIISLQSNLKGWQFFGSLSIREKIVGNSVQALIRQCMLSTRWK